MELKGKQLQLTERETMAVAVMVASLSRLQREDILGAILKNGAHRCLPSDGERTLIGLATKLRHHYQEARRTVPNGESLWPPLPEDPPA